MSDPLIAPEVASRIAQRYRGRFLQGYIRGKLRSDPAYQAALRAVSSPSLPVLDIGCGLGLFACFARESGFKMPIVGIDFDATKIAHARLGTACYADVRFELANAESLLPKTGHAILLDVIHYLDPAAQKNLLTQLSEAIAPGACCVIRTTLKDFSWRFRMTRASEKFIRAIGWMKAGPKYYSTAEELAAPFLRAGFTSETTSLWGKTPFNSHFFLFRRPGPSPFSLC
jgi:2-polyprenyl-3-methyl-5-hydroxy-6-metoxy-1,4-benzoquinol methylase